MKRNRHIYSFLMAGMLFAQHTHAQEKQLWEKQLNDVNKKMIEYIGGDRAVVFPIITDLHTVDLNQLNHIDRVVNADALLSFDFIANLGDIGLENGNTADSAVAEELMNEMKKRHNRYNGTTLFVRGNHDRNNKGSRPVSEKEWASRFTEPQRRKNPAMVTQESYGYYDIPQSKIRVLFLDTQTQDYYGLSKKELQFLANSLQIKETGWQVVILSHFCVDKIGQWKSYPDDTATNRDTYQQLLIAFLKRKKGEKGGVEWDFRKNGSSILVANFCGDSHFDNFINREGINFVITQGYGGVNPAELEKNEAQPTVTGRLPDEMLIDIVVIKPEKREFNIYRWGAGKNRLGLRY